MELACLLHQVYRPLEIQSLSCTLIPESQAKPDTKWVVCFIWSKRTSTLMLIQVLSLFDDLRSQLVQTAESHRHSTAKCLYRWSLTYREDCIKTCAWFDSTHVVRYDVQLEIVAYCDMVVLAHTTRQVSAPCCCAKRTTLQTRARHE